MASSCWWSTTTVLWPSVRSYPEPTQTFTHSHLSGSSTVLYQLPSSTTIHSNPLLNLRAWRSFCTTSLQVILVLVWNPPLHTPYISSPNHCLFFATRVTCPHHVTIATRFASKISKYQSNKNWESWRFESRERVPVLRNLLHHSRIVGLTVSLLCHTHQLMEPAETL